MLQISGFSTNSIQLNEIKPTYQESIDLQIDIQCYQEVCRDTRKSSILQRFLKDTKTMDRASKSVWGASEINIGIEWVVVILLISTVIFLITICEYTVPSRKEAAYHIHRFLRSLIIIFPLFTITVAVAVIVTSNSVPFDYVDQPWTLSVCCFFYSVFYFPSSSSSLSSLSSSLSLAALGSF